MLRQYGLRFDNRSCATAAGERGNGRREKDEAKHHSNAVAPDGAKKFL